MAITDFPTHPDFFMADNADEIQLGAERAWEEFCKILNCFYHVTKNLRQKRHLFTGKTGDESYETMFRQIQSISAITIGGDLDKLLLGRFENEWKLKNPEFVKAFSPEYGLANFDRKAGWIRARTESPAIPRTNNGAEGENDSMKADGTQREIVGVVACVQNITGYLQRKSQSDVTFEQLPEITKADWTRAQQFVQDGFLEVATEPRTTMAIVLSEDSKECLRKKTATQVRDAAREITRTFADVAENGGEAASLKNKTLEESLKICRSAHILRRVHPKAEHAWHPIKYQCSCAAFWHYYKCHHALGWAIRKGEITVPEQYETTSFGGARTGRPANKAKGGDALKKPASQPTKKRRAKPRRK